MTIFGANERRIGRKSISWRLVVIVLWGREERRNQLRKKYFALSIHGRAAVTDAGKQLIGCFYGELAFFPSPNFERAKASRACYY